MTQSTLSQGSSKEAGTNHLVELAQIIGGSLFIALCAQIKIPLFFTPVPLSMQTFGAMILGGAFGSRIGTLSLLTYLAELSAGLPFGASAAANSMALFSPVGGYLGGMVVQAYLTGLVFENRANLSQLKMLSSVFAISLIQMLMGATWLALYVGINNALTMGFFPFLAGDFVKCVAATTLLNKLNR